MVDMATVMGNLQRLGFFDFILPFVLFFAVIHGVIMATHVFGDPKEKGVKNISTIIAAAIAFFIIAFTPIGGTAAYYSTLFGVGGVIIGVLLVLVLLGGVLGYSPKQLYEGDKKQFLPLIAIVILILALVAFNSTALGGFMITLGIGSDTLTLLAVLLFVLLVIGYAEK